MSEPKKQFISGAECPACNEVDKIRMWYADGVPHRECAACGYADRLDADGQSLPAASVPADEVEVQSIRMLTNQASESGQE